MFYQSNNVAHFLLFDVAFGNFHQGLTQFVVKFVVRKVFRERIGIDLYNNMNVQTVEHAQLVFIIVVVPECTGGIRTKKL